jgi:hypothetical protein
MLRQPNEYSLPGALCIDSSWNSQVAGEEDLIARVSSRFDCGDSDQNAC